jgi:hypothetical protein
MLIDSELEDVSTSQTHAAVSMHESELYPDAKVTDTSQLTGRISVTHIEQSKEESEPIPVYRLYKRRFAGLFGFVSLLDFVL